MICGIGRFGDPSRGGLVLKEYFGRAGVVARVTWPDAQHLDFDRAVRLIDTTIGRYERWGITTAAAIRGQAQARERFATRLRDGRLAPDVTHIIAGPLQCGALLRFADVERCLGGGPMRMTPPDVRICYCAGKALIPVWDLRALYRALYWLDRIKGWCGDPPAVAIVAAAEFGVRDVGRVCRSVRAGVGAKAATPTPGPVVRFDAPGGCVSGGPAVRQALDERS